MGRLWINNQSTPKIKVCGVKTLETACDAYKLGIDALGFHLWLNKFSKRQLENYKDIISSIPKEISSVLLSDIIEPKIILPIFNEIPFDTFQIQGNLSFQSLEQIVNPIRNLNSNIKIIKSVSMEISPDQYNVENIMKIYLPLVDGFILDSKWRGGTGDIHDWNISAQLINKIDKPILLAGGLTPENVGCAINKVRPYGVDVQSGVEYKIDDPNNSKRTKRIKSILKIQSFVNSVKQSQIS